MEKLEKKIEYLEKYQEWLKKDELENIIDDYTQTQHNYNDQLNQINNFENSISNREGNLKKLEKISDLLIRLLFISNNDIETLIQKKKEEENRVEKTKKEIEANYKELSKVKLKLDELRTQFDRISKENLKKLTTLRNKKERIKDQLLTQFKLDLNNLEERKSNQHIIDIKKRIENYQDKIITDKKDIEKLNKENKRIIEINKYLTQLRDVCSKASSHDFGKERLIKTKIDKKK